MKGKDFVIEFYESDALRDKNVIDKFTHDDLEFHWHSSKGFIKMDKNDLMELASEMKRSYSSARIQIDQILQENEFISLRYVYYVSPIENPNEETILAYFNSIWELKDDKLYRCHQMSQLG